MKKKNYSLLLTLSFIFTISVILPNTCLAKKTKKKKIREGICTEVTDVAHITVSSGEKKSRLKLIGLEPLDDIVYPTYSKFATNFLKSILMGKKIVVEYPSGSTKDKTGALMALVFYDNKLANITVLEEGQAFYTSGHVPERYAEKFKAGEKLGKKNEKGFWSKSSSTITTRQMNDFMATQMNSNMGLFMNQNMKQMLPAANK